MKWSKSEVFSIIWGVWYVYHFIYSCGRNSKKKNGRWHEFRDLERIYTPESDTAVILIRGFLEYHTLIPKVLWLFKKIVAPYKLQIWSSLFLILEYFDLYKSDISTKLLRGFLKLPTIKRIQLWCTYKHHNWSSLYFVIVLIWSIFCGKYNMQHDLSNIIY